jgi:hypothetical protein
VAPEAQMSDLVFVLVALGFFSSSWAYVAGCRRL